MSESPGPLLEAEGIERAYGARRVLMGIDLALSPGAVLLLMGANGAGKTTLLRVLAGLAHPRRGAVRVLGRRISRTDPEARRPIGFLSHQTLLYDDLTLGENLSFAARLHGLDDSPARVRSALDDAGLLDRIDELPRRLSRGMQQRAALARALLHRPRVALLDEPFTGLDGGGVERLRARLREHRDGGGAAILVTHRAEEAWDLGTRVAVLVGGRLALEASCSGEAAAFEVRYREVAGA